MVNLPSGKVIKGILTGLLFLNNIFAAEQKEEITPANSTMVYYTIAEKAYKKLYKEYENYSVDKDTNDIPGLLSKPIPPEEARRRLKITYRHNILECGYHPGIPEQKWDKLREGKEDISKENFQMTGDGLRGDMKFANHRLIMKIREFYESDYQLNEGIQLMEIGTFDPLEQPYINYSADYVPKKPKDMNEDEKKFVEKLKAEFDKDTPPDTIDYSNNYYKVNNIIHYPFNK